MRYVTTIAKSKQSPHLVFTNHEGMSCLFSVVYTKLHISNLELDEQEDRFNANVSEDLRSLYNIPNSLHR